MPMPPRPNQRRCALALAACMTFGTIGSTRAQPQGAELSPYVRLLIGYAGSAATAVACGDRSMLWGVSVHTQILRIITAHAGSPIQNSHTPSTDERNAAITALTQSEDAGTRQGTRSAACRVVRTLYLDDLDQFEAGQKSFWPTSVAPDEDPEDQPATI